MARSMSYCGNKRQPLDLSNKFEDTYIEIPPYTKDEKGNWLNDTKHSILKKTGRVNVFDKIQSYKDECDIYSILKRVAATGDTSLLNQRQGVYADIADVPKDYHQAVKLAKSQDELLSRIDADDQNKLADLLNRLFGREVVSKVDNVEVEKEIKREGDEE